MQYLKSKQYYEDLYDRATVTRCRWIEDFHKNYKLPEKIKKKGSPEDLQKIQNITLNFDLMFTTGERYLNRDQTIQEWIDRDTEKQNLYENAEAPENIDCLACKELMTPTSRILWDTDSKGDRVLFMYDCPNECMPRRSFFHDGEEYERRPRTCSKCGGTIVTTNKTTKKKSVTTETCQSCGEVEVDEFVFKTKEEKPDENYERDKQRFCLSAEKGAEYVKTKQWFKDLESLMKDIKEREEHKDEYDAAKKLEKLTLVQLEKKLTPALETEGYMHLVLDKPEMDRDVRVGFTVQDEKDKREEFTSRSKLKKAIEKTLESTNWRLMSEGVSWRLGILTGRFRGYEREEDLLKLVQSSNEHKR